jgi:hypothetical protein
MCEFTKPQHRVLFGATVLGFFFLLRSAEYLTIDGARQSYCLQVGDVQVFDMDNRATINHNHAYRVRVHLRGSKTDQYGEGATRSLVRARGAAIRPVLAALLLLQNAHRLGLSAQDPLCSISSRKVLSGKTVTAALRLVAAASGTDAATLSTHSLRVGGATALFQGGADENSIKFQGRWRSNAYTRYTRPAETFGQHLTTKML